MRSKYYTVFFFLQHLVIQNPKFYGNSFDGIPGNKMCLIIDKKKLGLDWTGQVGSCGSHSN